MTLSIRGTSVVACGLPVSLLANPEAALALRRGNHLVAEGETQIAVLRACGEPDNRKRIGSHTAGASSPRAVCSKLL